MEFDIKRVYTSVNADELKVGSKVVVANTKQGLISKVEFNEITELKTVLPDCYTNRFQAYFNEDLINYNLCYLVSEPEEKKLKWTDLKIGDVIRMKEEIRMVTGISMVSDNSEMHIFNGTNWLTDEELEEWEKVDYELEEYERRVEQ